MSSARREPVTSTLATSRTSSFLSSLTASVDVSAKAAAENAIIKTAIDIMLYFLNLLNTFNTPFI